MFACEIKRGLTQEVTGNSERRRSKSEFVRMVSGGCDYIPSSDRLSGQG